MKLITNTQNKNMLNELQKSLKECKSFYFSVAFINFSGLQLLLDTFKELEEKDIKGKIITSTYLNFTDLKALEKRRSFKNIDLKVFVKNKEIGFHTKAYIFGNEDNYKVIIGLSNITQSELKSNIEWNVEIISKLDAPFIQDIMKKYNNLWEISENVDDEFIEKYEDFINQLKNHNKTENMIFENLKIITPNTMQKRAIENLDRLRI